MNTDYKEKTSGHKEQSPQKNKKHLYAVYKQEAVTTVD